MLLYVILSIILWVIARLKKITTHKLITLRRIMFLICPIRRTIALNLLHKGIGLSLAKQNSIHLLQLINLVPKRLLQFNLST